MAWQDRSNRALRWLAAGYFSGLVGTILALGRLPNWLALGLAMEAAPVGYACFHHSLSLMVGRGRRSGWISLGIIALPLPLYLLWSNGAHMSASATLQDLALAVQTMAIAWLLSSTRDFDTRAPRYVMAAFFAIYAGVEWLRVAVFALTHRMPARVWPGLEFASALVYVISCSVLPLAFIWMMNVRLHQVLRRQAQLDPLTSLLNRRGLQSACERALAYRDQTRATEFALVLMDLDHFKNLNDTFGHPDGDSALCQVAEFLTAHVPPGAIIGRLGGEEFLIGLPQGARGACPAGIQASIEALRHQLQSQTIQTDGGRHRLTASVGIAASEGRADIGWMKLLREANVALYAAKRGGRNRVETFAPRMEAQASGATV